MLLKRIVPMLMVLLSVIPASYGQEYPYIHYTPKDGLVNSRIRNIFQDSKGRMFFMTTIGFSLYDGARFKNYTVETGLPDPIVNDMIEVGEDSILVATNTGQLNAWVRGKVVKIQTENNDCPVINRFLRTRNASIYAATDQGLFLLDKNHFIHLDVPEGYLVTGCSRKCERENGISGFDTNIACSACAI